MESHHKGAAYIDVGVQTEFSWGDLAVSVLPIVGSIKSGITWYKECF